MVPREALKGSLHSVRRDDTADRPVTPECMFVVDSVGEFRDKTS